MTNADKLPVAEQAPTVWRIKPPLWRRVRAKGVNGTLEAIASRLYPPRVSGHKTLISEFAGRRGLEIGGPSDVFARRGLFPIYPVVASVDNVNFSATTVWGGTIAEGRTYSFQPDRARGHQFVLEATELAGIPSLSYDFLVSSHAIEHIANPLKAMREWKRVIRPGGYLALVVPDKHRTFDHRRPTTPMHHLVQDLERDVGEDDLTHVDESERLHDDRRDPGELCAGVPLATHNFATRVMHHHVFDLDLVQEVVEHARLQLLVLHLVRPCHIFALARRE